MDHRLQLFDTGDSLARAVAGFLGCGEELEQQLLVVCTAAHWEAVAAVLKANRFDPAVAIRDGRMTVLDADECLPKILRRGQPDSVLFRRVIGRLVARLAARSARGLRVYGELVELLARDGNYDAAVRLEELWNELGSEIHFTLLCGYSAAHFAAPDAGSALSAICSRHLASHSEPADALGHFLLASERSRAADAGGV